MKSNLKIQIKRKNESNLIFLEKNSFFWASNQRKKTNDKKKSHENKNNAKLIFKPRQSLLHTMNE